jgi:hypothetical protein
MNFDLTREILLDKKNQRLYQILQITLYLTVVLMTAYLSVKILFPSLFFQFNFSNPNATSNTITKPLDNSRQPLNHGLLPAGQKASFNTSLTGNFSQAVITFILDKESSDLKSDSQLIARKSYTAFLYPTTTETAQTNNNNPGIFNDGALISYGDSIYIVSGENIFPIDSPTTFLSKGYVWNDVVAVGADELAAYKKGKLFTIASPHPNGTIFKTTADGKYYLVANGSKHLLSSEEVASLNLKHSPILVSEDSLNIINNCQFKKNIWPLRSYSCEMPIDNMQKLIGSDYEFTLGSSQNIKIASINVEFKKDATLQNLRFTLGELFKRAKNNYVPEN